MCPLGYHHSDFLANHVYYNMIYIYIYIYIYNRMLCYICYIICYNRIYVITGYIYIYMMFVDTS